VTCIVDVIAEPAERLGISTTVRRTGEDTWASVRFHIVAEPVQVSVSSTDAAVLIRELLRAAQQLSDKTVTTGATLPDDWRRVSLL
jgi:hypothetical protein